MGEEILEALRAVNGTVEDVAARISASRCDRVTGKGRPILAPAELALAQYRAARSELAQAIAEMTGRCRALDVDEQFRAVRDKMAAKPRRKSAFGV